MRGAFMVAAFVAFLAVGAAARMVEDVTPVQKVIELLEENKVKVTKDLAAEEAEMQKYSEFCDTEASEKGYAIKTAIRQIADLSAKVQDTEAQVASDQETITATSSMIASKEGQLHEAEAVREAAKANFQGNEKELLTSIDELERAVITIQKGSSLLQLKSGVRGSRKVHDSGNIKRALMALGRIVDASWVNTQSRKKIQNLMQTQESESDGDDLSLHSASAPKAAAYESATGGILKTLEEMKEKAEEALADAQHTEANDQHSHNMMAQSLTDAIEAGKEKLATTQENMAQAAQELGEAKNENVETQKAKASDEAYVASLNAECASTQKDWEARQEDAHAEMAALDKAKEILSAKVRVFVQTASKQGGDDIDSPIVQEESATRSKMVMKLKNLSARFKSFALMELVSAAAADPFEKVKGLIESMIAKLQTEANEEATQKAFCDEETSKSKASQSEKTLTIDKLQSRLDTAASKKSELENAVKELEAEIAELDKGTKEATAVRQQEHADFLVASKDYKDGADGVEQAMMVLKEYYEGASLVQKGAQPAFGGSKGDAAASILSILEMCAENFTKMYMELQQAEAEAVAAYKKLTKESEVSRAAKVAEVKGAESEIKSLGVAIKDHQEDYDTTSLELDAVNSYLEKLKPQCEAKAMSYEEKKARRAAEIEGLKEALSILGA